MQEPTTKLDQLRQVLEGPSFTGNLDELVSACCENNEIKRLSHEHKQKLCSYKLTDETKLVLLVSGFGAYLVYGVLFRKEPACHIANMIKYDHIRVDEVDSKGFSILYWAVHFNDAKAVKEIVGFKSRVDAQTRKLAESSNNSDIKEFLGIPVAVQAMVARDAIEKRRVSSSKELIERVGEKTQPPSP